MDQCWTVWMDFKEFIHNTAHGAIIHVLTVLQSHYPLVKPEVIMTGFAQGTNTQKVTKLEDEAEEVAAKLARDIDLFGEGQGNVW